MAEEIVDYGLIGYPLSHSFSPGYFSEKFNKLNLVGHNYKAYPIASIEGLKNIIIKSLRGLNVTTPYKEQIIPYMSELSELAQEIQSVNTIKIIGDKLMGYNTDVYGFENSLTPLLGGSSVKSALILGTGGASKAVKYVLEKLGIDYLVVSRKSDSLTYKSLTKDIIDNHQLIINCTPVGMYPNIKEKPPINYEAISDKHILFDLIYNPEKTLFLKEGEKRNAQIKNGLEMLKFQADRSWEIWQEN